MTVTWALFLDGIHPPYEREKPIKSTKLAQAQTSLQVGDRSLLAVGHEYT